MRQTLPLFYVIPHDFHLQHRHLIAESHAIPLDANTDFVVIEFRGPMERKKWEEFAEIELFHPLCISPISSSVAQALSSFGVTTSDTGWTALEKVGAVYPHFRV